MKKVMKRMAAFVLTVCLLLTALPASVVAVEYEDIPTGSTVYDLDLYTTYRSTPLLEDDLADIQSKYNSGSLNWCFQAYSMATLGSSAFKSYGMTLYCSEMDWVAFKIKSPGEGLHTVGLNYTSSINSGVGAVYVLPADTVDIAGAMEYNNRVGQVTLTNLVDSSNTAEQAFVGTWEFGTDDEYILVLEANRHTVYNDSRCYLMLRQVFMTPGDIMEEAQQQTVPSSVTVDPGPIKILSPAPYYGVTTQINGNDCLFMPIKGGTMLVFDLDENVLLDEVAIPPSIARGMAVDEDGVLWCVGESKYLFRYDPKTRIGESVLNLEDVIDGAEDALYLHYADGYLYFGIFPSGVICKYKIADGTFEYFGPFHEDCNSVSAIIPQGNYIYAGITGDVDGENGYTSQVIKVNATTGEVEGRLDLSSGSDAEVKLNESHRQFNGVALAGNLLLMGSNVAQDFIIAVDVRDMSFVDLNTDLGIDAGVEFDFTEEVEIGDKTYIYFYLTGKGIYSLDVTGVTADTVITDNINIQLAHENITGWVNPKPLRCGKNSIVEIDDPEFPGKCIVTYYTSDGAPRLYNLQTGETRICLDLVESGYGTAMPARPIVNGVPGSGELYMGAFNTSLCATYNTATGELTNFKSNADQTDSFVVYDGVLYTGNYNDASISRIVPGGENVKLLSMKESHNQARIHTLTAGDGKVFAGTTPYTGYGGCLAWVDVQNNDATYVVPNIVENQSIDCLVYYDGLVFGTTNIKGGSGSGTLEGLSAKLFVFDVAANSKVAEFDLRDEPYKTELGIADDTVIDYIAGIAADPNEPGKFWGMVSQTLFSFTYDKETGELTLNNELSFGANAYVSSRSSFPRPFCFDGKGNLYVAFDDAGGMRRINTADPADNERLPVGTLSYYALGEDGNLYFTWGDQLCMFPLNVAQEDWDAAAAVDEMILAAGKSITAESKEQIVAARAAYDDLSLTDKALVQQRYLLEELEAELLELQIAELPAVITHDEKEQLDALWDTYSALTDRQKNCIKNYDVLIAAINAEQAYDGAAAFQANGKAYCNPENAVAAAIAAQDKTITLVENATVEELLLTDGITLDLGGKTLTTTAFRANLPDIAEGFVVDSSADNTGLLQTQREEDLFRANNPDLPLYDAQSGGYRFFDYKLELRTQTTNVGTGREKFWFKFHFYTDDTCAAMDSDAYALIRADGTNLEISTDISWKSSFLRTVSFGWKDEGGELKTDLFAAKWATDETLNRWLYITVSGLDKAGYGKLEVTPVITANGVTAQSGAISYQNKFSTDTGWDDNGPANKN